MPSTQLSSFNIVSYLMKIFKTHILTPISRRVVWVRMQIHFKRDGSTTFCDALALWSSTEYHIILQRDQQICEHSLLCIFSKAYSL